jgi:putative ATP-binding cassette transporter
MEALRRELPDTTVLSVGHRPGLEAFHDRRYLLVPADDGARLVPADTVTAVVPRSRRTAGAALQSN